MASFLLLGAEHLLSRSIPYRLHVSVVFSPMMAVGVASMMARSKSLDRCNSRSVFLCSVMSKYHAHQTCDISSKVRKSGFRKHNFMGYCRRRLACESHPVGLPDCGAMRGPLHGVNLSQVPRGNIENCLPDNVSPGKTRIDLKAVLQPIYLPSTSL